MEIYNIFINMTEDGISQEFKLKNIEKNKS